MVTATAPHRRSYCGSASADPQALHTAISAAGDPAAVAAFGRSLPGAVAELARSGADVRRVGSFVSDTIDAMTRRLIDLSIADQGPPPVAWAWLALGSAARREQGIATDQDHALAYEPGPEGAGRHDGYFRLLAERVTAGLEAAGIPACRAGVVAASQELRRPVDHWNAAFRTWMADPDVRSVRQTAILFDHRRVAGPLDVAPLLARTIAAAPDRGAYLERLRTMAVEATPRPPHRVLRLADLKHDGLLPIVSLGRIVGLSCGAPSPGTLDRLDAAAAHGAIEHRLRDRLSGAFRLLSRIRLERQLDAWAAGRVADDIIHRRDVSTRRLLGEALEAVHEGLLVALRARGDWAMMREMRPAMLTR